MPTLLDAALSESSPLTLGLAITLLVLLSAAIASHFRMAGKLTTSLTKTESTAEAAIAAVASVAEVAKSQGAKLDKLVENTAEMRADIRHIADKQNGAVPRPEFDALEKRVTRLESKGGE